MSQSRFSIVLVGVSALLRRPLVSRLRPADGERSPWVVFAARRCLPFRRLPLGELAFGFTASAFRHAPLRGCRSAVSLRAHDFRFSARTASGLPLGGLAFGLTASAFRHAPLRGCPRRVGLRAHRFRFSACATSGLPLGGLAFGLTASAFRHAPLRDYPRRVGSSAFRFGDCRSAG